MPHVRPLLLAAALAATLPAPARAADESIACVYAGADRPDLAAIADSSRGAARSQAKISDEAAMDRVADVAAECRDRHQWSDPKAVAAITYAMGRVTYEREVAALTARGLDEAFLETVAADLGPDAMQAIVAGNQTEENLSFVGDVVARRLIAAGQRIPPGSPEWAEIGGHIGRGLSAGVTRDRAIEAFERE